MTIPYVSLEQISKLDSLMVNHFKIPVMLMMENAGYRMAEFVRLIFPKKKNVLIIVGKGNNGGDGLAAARHLLNFGFKPKVFLVAKNLKTEPKMHYEINKILKIETFSSLKKLKAEIKKTDLIYDCLIGYNLKEKPRGKFVDIIKLINSSKKKIIACDVPSGIDTNKGIIYDTFVKATHILFLSLPKKGCKNFKSEKYTADIGIPEKLYSMINVKQKNYFKNKTIVKI